MTTTTPIEAIATIDSPLGPLLLAARADGLAGAWFTDQRHLPPPIAAPVDPGHPHIAAARRDFAAYWQRPDHVFGVPLAAAGTPFQRAVWQALTAIGSGSTSTYGAVAQRIGQPAAVRAVGAAVGRNPLSIIVPCHRVVGSGGALTGYAGGIDRKRRLLAHEAAPVFA